MTGNPRKEKNNSQMIKDVFNTRKTRSKKTELASQGSEKQQQNVHEKQQQQNVPKEKKKM